jgi:hypothetical protein
VRSSAYRWHRRYAIPLSCPAAFSFYLKSLALPHSLSEILWITMSRRWPPLGRAMLYSLQKKNSRASIDRHAGSTTPQLTNGQLLNQNMLLHLRNAGIEPSGILSLLLLIDHQKMHRNQSVAFVFDDSRRAPLAVAKFGTDQQAYSALKQQNDTLKRLEQILDTDKGVRVPRPLAFFESPPWTVSLESYLPGCTAYFEMRNSWNPLRDAPKHFRLALKWLICFQRAVGLKKMHLTPAAMFDFVIRPLEEVAAQGCPSAAELRLIERTKILAKEFLGATLLLVAGHGDFWAGNLVNHSNSVSMIDWENFEAEALPFEDLFFFSTTYGLNFPWRLGRWAAPQTAFQATYLQATEIADLVRSFLLDYCRAMNLEARLIEIFFPVFLAKKAMQSTSFEVENNDIGRGNGQRKNPNFTDIAETRNIGANIWRRFFQIYAESTKPSCFSNGPERNMESVHARISAY